MLLSHYNNTKLETRAHVTLHCEIYDAPSGMHSCLKFHGEVNFAAKSTVLIPKIKNVSVFQC